MISSSRIWMFLLCLLFRKSIVSTATALRSRPGHVFLCLEVSETTWNCSGLQCFSKLRSEGGKSTLIRRVRTWKMPNSQRTSPYKRPPLLRARRSSSYQEGMEQTVPYFQPFKKRTPLPSDEPKHFPPPSSVLRRASSASPSQSRTPSPFGARRSSSVYSRTISQWEDISWRTEDFADNPLPLLPLLQPVAYSASTPQLVEKPTTPPLLQPRTYTPPSAAPPSKFGRNSTPSPPLRDNISATLPMSTGPNKPPKKQMETISLEKAKAAIHAPGALHLLPEELRAQQNRRRSKSSDPAARFPTMDFWSAVTPPELPEPPALVDSQGRRRTITTPRGDAKAPPAYPFPVMGSGTKNSPKAFNFGGESQFDEPRGRPRHRSIRKEDDSKIKRRAPDSSFESEARGRIAEEYRSILPERDRYSSSSPGELSDGSIRMNMKMIPRPLFQTKPPAKLPREIVRRDSEQSVSPYNLSVHTGEVKDFGSDSTGDIFPPMTPVSSHRRSSTSGSIPISPPTMTDTRPPFQPQQPVTIQPKPIQKTQRRQSIARVSAYYPHIASRKGSKVRPRKQSVAQQRTNKIPPMPFLSNNVDGQDLRPFLETPDWSRATRVETTRPPKETRQPFYARLAKNAAKYADLLTKPEILPDWKPYTPITASTISPGSPHLLPSPVRAKPPGEVHLGWSDVSKSTFDSVVSPRLPPPGKLSPVLETGPHFTHITTPARPLDETRDSLKESGDVRGNGGPGIFGGIFDGWKENKAEKRREELKRNIKVVARV